MNREFVDKVNSFLTRCAVDAERCGLKFGHYGLTGSIYLESTDDSLPFQVNIDLPELEIGIY